MFKFNRLLIATLLLLLPLLIAAQTSSDLRQKYRVSSIVESYEVRPNVIATVSFGENNQIASILIRPRPSFDDDDKSKTEIPYKLIVEVLNELVPVAQRGKLYQDTGFESGRNYYRDEFYDNVYIYSVIHNWGEPNATVSQMYVTLKKSYR